MHIGRSYRLVETLYWTRRKAYLLVASSLALTALYEIAGWRWLALPWPVVAMLGTAASFIVGFKNAQTYSRTLEAQQIWSSITAASRHWGLISRDFPVSADNALTADLVRRHLAWLTAVRYQLRTPRVWEAAAGVANAEYRKRRFEVEEQSIPLADSLADFLPREALPATISAGVLAATLINQQSAAIKRHYASGQLAVLHHTETQKTLKELMDQHARAERIKDYPYPRQYAVINTTFVWSFALLLPLGLMTEFARLGAPAALHQAMVWLAVPFSVLLAWMYVALDQVGESTENPFEGGANDVPITYLCRCIETELRAILGESGRPGPVLPSSHILL
jgi:putative membrane protein